MNMRIALVATTALAVVLLPATAAGATNTNDSCAAEASGWTAYALNTTWKPGDPVPNGSYPLWDVRSAQVLSSGFASLDEFAHAFGLASEADLFALKQRQWAAEDANGDGILCVKEGPAVAPKGFPDYAAGFKDNKTAATR